MKARIKIAFDLDGVIIDKPPLIPKKLLEKLFRGFKNSGLNYRFPKSKLEQKIRKLSHYYLFRPPIRKNINFIKELSNDKNYELYVISGRYSFLEKETEIWLEKRNVKNLFKNIFINLENEQPHLFKEKIINEIKPDIFIDDDGALADFLAKNSKTKIYCYSSKKCGTACNMKDLPSIIK